jgi:hypothetical protein
MVEDVFAISGTLFQAHGAMDNSLEHYIAEEI